MAVAPSSSPETLDPKLDKPDSEIPPSTSLDPSPFPPPASTPAATPAAENPNPNPNSNPNPTPPNPSPNPNLNPTVVTPPPPSFAPSFRPLGAPPVPQYPTYPNLSYPMAQSPGIQPPGVTAPGVSIMLPGAANGAGAVTVSVPPTRPSGMYTILPGQAPAAAPMAYGHAPNGYMMMPGAPLQAPPGMHPPGIVRYMSPFSTMVRPGFPPRPMPPMGVVPQLPRPLIPGVRPIVTPAMRPLVPIVAPPEKPQTTVYVGKIAPTVGNDFLLSLLRLCGPVKSWKRAQDPSDGTPKGFGFCEFESAEGILRAMRLLTKLNIDGQELVLNINQATREYLERYVEKKTEREKLKETEAQVAEKENEGAPGVEKQEAPKSVVEETKKEAEDSGDKENHEKIQNFGIVTDDDRDADNDALEKITNMIGERLKTKPLPPPPPVHTPVDGSARSNSDVPSKSRDGDSDVDIMKSDAAEEKNDDETTSENKPMTEPERPEISSPDRGRRHDRGSRERDRERDLKRDKERELERYERERERERVRRERERERELIHAECFYKDRVKEWEAREREKEYQRQKEREREKEYQRERRREILKDENESDDDDTRKRRRRSNVYEEKRRKRQREKDDDLADRLKEEEEIAEAKKMVVEEQPSKDELMPLSSQVINESVKPMMQEAEFYVGGRENSPDLVHEGISSPGNNSGDGSHRNNSSDEPNLGSAAVSDMKQVSNAPTRKLGFGLVGSGKRTTVPSVFHEEDDEGVDEKKMRPLVPIDYSTEELQAVQPSASGPSPNLAAAAEFAKRISSANPKEDKPEMERERNGRSNDRSSKKERDRNDEEYTRARNESKERMHDKIFDRERDREDKPKTDNKKLLDAKQLIDMIPKTKEELFAYEINWATYDKYELQERMRPWISKKITEFLGEEEPTLVDYIVSSTKDHVQASKMLELLQSILDDEAEMFVLKMWRMLIFEIKKVESGLSGKSRS